MLKSTILSSLLIPCLSFSPNGIKQRMALTTETTRTSSPSSSSTRTTTTTNLFSHVLDSEEEAMFLMASARECANSESCSIDQAEEYLNAVLDIQGGCAAGVLTSQELCEDVTLPASVVAELRFKIEKGTQEMANSNPFAAKNIMNPFFLTVVILYFLAGIISVNQNDPTQVDAFTSQELWWAIRDGYAPQLFHQFIKHGGMSVDDTTLVTRVPFTPEEWFMSMRDGYLFDMISSSIKNGGMEVNVNDVLSGEYDVHSAFTSEEWKYALRDGYLGEMIDQYMKNGGL